MKSPIPSRRATLIPIEAGYGNKMAGIDITGPLPETQLGIKYIIVVMDCFTKWIEVAALPFMEAAALAQAVFDHKICKKHLPGQLHPDGGAVSEILHYLNYTNRRKSIKLVQLPATMKAMDQSNGITGHSRHSRRHL
ncbi:hypothetical protein FGIG_00168 [Fasciola gigantica]|uniref:Integrase catalytic domain-containing protein n=1 Tax=Fasciola gigantica TaxID=46835 RepID=A0A504Y8X4_FASGI|nr:hypothetical protein FGIG_00168 [Fasciola gigantica]